MSRQKVNFMEQAPLINGKMKIFAVTYYSCDIAV